jgi:hypothetical protein
MFQFVGEKKKFERFFGASFLDESARACDG